MTLGKRGEQLIKKRELFSFNAYLPTPDDVPTIAWGHTKGVKLGMTCTLEQGQQWFIEDMQESVDAVRRLMAKMSIPLTQSMFDALVSLVYNTGESSISSGSTIGSALITQKDYYKAWAGFTLWRKQAKKDLLGLARRRSEEMTLFLEDGIPR